MTKRAGLAPRGERRSIFLDGRRVLNYAFEPFYAFHVTPREKLPLCRYVPRRCKTGKRYPYQSLRQATRGTSKVVGARIGEAAQ